MPQFSFLRVWGRDAKLQDKLILFWLSKRKKWEGLGGGVSGGKRGAKSFGGEVYSDEFGIPAPMWLKNQWTFCISDLKQFSIR